MSRKKKETKPIFEDEVKDEVQPEEIVPKVADTLLGEEVEGSNGEYFHCQEGDTREAGFLTSGTGVRIPKTMHIPTGSKWSYVKVYQTLTDGSKRVVWKKWKEV